MKGKKVGLITNPTAVTRDYRHALDAMLDAGIQVVVYGPEHGVRERSRRRGAGFLEDPRTGLPFINLYGKQPEEMVPLFDGVDVLIFDIQDVGTRLAPTSTPWLTRWKRPPKPESPSSSWTVPIPSGETRWKGRY